MNSSVKKLLSFFSKGLFLTVLIGLSGCGANNMATPLQSSLADGTEKIINSSIKAMPNNTLCTYATDGLKKNWETAESFQVYVNEAKSRGLDCGVENKPSNYNSDQLAETEKLSEISAKRVCLAAASNGKWNSEQYLKPYVLEAKRRGLKCGVQQVKRTSTNAQKSNSDKAPEKTKNQLDDFMKHAVQRLLDIGTINVNSHSALIKNLENKEKSEYEKLYNNCKNAFENLTLGLCDRLLLEQLK